MATYTKFNIFGLDLANGVHNLAAAGDTLKVYLSNAAPNAETHSLKAEVAEITNQNGYTAPIDVTNDTSRSGATTTVAVIAEATITASGGPIGPFKYAVVYNDTTSAKVDPLVCWWEYPGAAVTLADGEAFKIDFGANLFTFS